MSSTLVTDSSPSGPTHCLGIGSGVVSRRAIGSHEALLLEPHLLPIVEDLKLFAHALSAGLIETKTHQKNQNIYKTLQETKRDRVNSSPVGFNEDIIGHLIQLSFRQSSCELVPFFEKKLVPEEMVNPVTFCSSKKWGLNKIKDGAVCY